jgi:hypothetical protein
MGTTMNAYASGVRPKESPQIDPDPPEGFGPLLRYYRETYPKRVGGPHAGPEMHLTAASVIAWLRDAGYKITPGSYSEIEAGRSIPHDAKEFLDVIQQCLKLSEREFAWLKYYLGRDVLRGKVGSYADEMLVRPS